MGHFPIPTTNNISGGFKNPLRGFAYIYAGGLKIKLNVLGIKLTN